MFKVTTDQWPVCITPHLKVAYYQIVYEGPEEGIVKTGLSSILFAIAVNPKTGRQVKAQWEKGGSCVLLGPIKAGKKGTIKLRVEGR